MVMQGRRLSRTQVLAWNEPWSTRDRVWITAALDAIPNGVCVVPRAGDRIGVWMDGRLALVIRPGYLSWPGGQWATDLGPGLFPEMYEDEHFKWHELSTFRPHTGGPTAEEPPAAICPSCFMARPRTGVCDNCG
jgi:hypothetical protein